ncbi:MAG: hypothetical protein KDH94_03880, partial [Coxiellaceae bacterium]|nr:hypothetical protein [Coxiellaceae bacterium]
MKKTKKILQSTAALLALAVSTTFAADNVIPFGNGTWVYDGQYTTTGKKLPNKAGLFLPQLTQFNQTAAHPFNEAFAYG